MTKKEYLTTNIALYKNMLDIDYSNFQDDLVEVLDVLDSYGFTVFISTPVQTMGITAFKYIAEGTLIVNSSFDIENNKRVLFLSVFFSSEAHQSKCHIYKDFGEALSVEIDKIVKRWLKDDLT